MQRLLLQGKRAVKLSKNSSALTILFKNKLRRSKSRGNIFLKDKQVYEDPKLVTESFSGHLCFSLTNVKPLNDSEIIPAPPCEITNADFNVRNISTAITTLKHPYTDGLDTIPASMLKRGDDNICVLPLKLFATTLYSVLPYCLENCTYRSQN